MHNEDELFDRFQEEYLVLFRSGEGIRIEATPATWWCMMSAVQLACRHPDFDGPTRHIAEQAARQIQRLIAPSGALAIVAERGWNPDHDEETES